MEVTIDIVKQEVVDNTVSYNNTRDVVRPRRPMFQPEQTRRGTEEIINSVTSSSTNAMHVKQELEYDVPLEQSCGITTVDVMDILNEGEQMKTVMEPRLRASSEQFATIIEFMERHGDLLQLPAGLRGRLRAEALWRDLARRLNKLGGVRKSHEKWKKVWADWKSKTKKKARDIRRATKLGTNRVFLSATERRVLAVADVRTRDSTEKQPQNEADGAGRVSPSAAGLRTGGSVGERTEHRVPVNTRNVSTMTSQSEQGLDQSEASRRPQRRRRPIRAAHAQIRNQFALLEQRRLRAERERDGMLHEREMERLRLEARWLEVDREHNQLLRNLADMGRSALELLRVHFS